MIYFYKPASSFNIAILINLVHKRPVSRDRVSPLEVSPPETLFRYRFSPGGSVSELIRPRRLYSKPKSPGGETISSLVEINSPRGRGYFDVSYALVTLHL